MAKRRSTPTTPATPDQTSGIEPRLDKNGNYNTLGCPIPVTAELRKRTYANGGLVYRDTMPMRVGYKRPVVSAVTHYWVHRIELARVSGFQLGADEWQIMRDLTKDGLLALHALRDHQIKELGESLIVNGTEAETVDSLPSSDYRANIRFPAPKRNGKSNGTV